METIPHARKAAYQDDVVVSLKALPIAMEGGHAKMKRSILLLEAPQATAHMERKMKQSILLLKAHQTTAQMEKGGHVKVKQSILLLETAYCSCKKGCSPRRCGYVMKGKTCSSLCHGGREGMQK